MIRRFFTTLLMVLAAEFFMLVFPVGFLMQFISDVFFPGLSTDGIGAMEILTLLGTILGLLLLHLVSKFLPDRFGRPVLEAFISIWEKKADMQWQGGFSYRLSGIQELFLLLLLLVIVCLLLLPIFFGGMAYVSLVTKQFRIIEEQQRERQREYEKKRNLMLSDIAHDLRTPITTIAGYTKALSDGMVPAEKKEEYLDAIQSKSKRMNELITLLFEYVKTDSEGFALQKEKQDLCETIRECVALSYQDIEDAGMELEVEIPEESIEVSIDNLQFSRTVTNLINNAIRHNEAGTCIGVFLLREDRRLLFMIADSGQRIEESVAKHLFEPFVMGDESRSSKGGSGLGLSIAKKIMELHGFSISLLQKPLPPAYKLPATYQKTFLIEIPLS